MRVFGILVMALILPLCVYVFFQLFMDGESLPFTVYLMFYIMSVVLLSIKDNGGSGGWDDTTAY